MTPIERYQHLKTFWKAQETERFEEWKKAKAELSHWSNKLVEAEIVEQLAKEHD